MLKKSVSSVLASLRGSTYRSVRLASSLAAALLNGILEHPVILPVPAFEDSSHVFDIKRILLQPANPWSRIACLS